MTKPHWIPRLLVAGLATTLVAQIVGTCSFGVAEAVRPIQAGEKVHLDVVTLNGERRVALACRVAFLVDPDCPFSRALIAHLDTLDAERRPTWLSIAGEEQTKRFAREVSISEIFRFSPPRGRGASAIRTYLDIPATPTRLVFGADETVRDMQMTSSLDLPPTADPACQNPFLNRE